MKVKIDRKSILCAIVAVGTAAGFALMAGPANAYTCPSDKFAHVNDAARLAVNSPWVGHDHDKCVSLNHHQFWVKAVRLVHLDNGNYRGRLYEQDPKANHSPQLSHILSFRPDDQYYFQFEITPEGKMAEFKYGINRGGFTKVIVESLKVVNVADPVVKALTGVSVDKWTGDDVQKLVTKWGQSAGQKLEGTWEGTADTVALDVVAAAAAKVKQMHPPVRLRGFKPPTTILRKAQ